MVQVVAKKLDGKSLILENPETGETITWPIDKITEPLEIGDKLALKLTSDSSSNEATSDKTTKIKEPDKHSTDRRKLLESLIN